MLDEVPISDALVHTLDNACVLKYFLFETVGVIASHVVNYIWATIHEEPKNADEAS